MSYWTKDGVQLTGTTPKQVMLSLRASAWCKSKDLETYMQKAARFAGYLSGQRIRSKTAEMLLEDLLRAGFIIKKGDS